jgi:hypothetical protein
LLKQILHEPKIRSANGRAHLYSRACERRL